MQSQLPADSAYTITSAENAAKNRHVASRLYIIFSFFSDTFYQSDVRVYSHAAIRMLAIDTLRSMVLSSRSRALAWSALFGTVAYRLCFCFTAHAASAPAFYPRV